MNSYRKRPRQYSDTTTNKLDNEYEIDYNNNHNDTHNIIRSPSISAGQHQQQYQSTENLFLSINWENDTTTTKNNGTFNCCPTAVISCITKKDFQSNIHQETVNYSNDNNNCNNEVEAYTTIGKMTDTTGTVINRNIGSDNYCNSNENNYKDVYNDNGSTIMIVLQGKGYIEVLPSLLCTSTLTNSSTVRRQRFVDINGYRTLVPEVVLVPEPVPVPVQVLASTVSQYSINDKNDCASSSTLPTAIVTENNNQQQQGKHRLTNNNNNNNNISSATKYYFESYIYGSWVTVLLPSNTSIRISSSYSFCQGKKENQIVYNVDDNTDTKNTNTNDSIKNSNNIRKSSTGTRSTRIQHSNKNLHKCTTILQPPTFKIHYNDRNNNNNNTVDVHTTANKKSTEEKMTNTKTSTNAIDYSYYGPSIPNTSANNNNNNNNNNDTVPAASHTTTFQNTNNSNSNSIVTAAAAAAAADADAAVRPTIYPTSWQDTCTLLFNDYYNMYYYCNSTIIHSNNNNYNHNDITNENINNRETEFHFMSDQPFDDDDDDDNNNNNNDVADSGDNNDDNNSNDSTVLDTNEINHNQHQNGYQILIVGDRKQVGTSTAVRYCINRFLSEKQILVDNNNNDNDECANSSNVSVIVLDANPDRPEFFLSGIIGLTEITSKTSLAASSSSSATVLPILFPTHRSILYSTMTAEGKSDDDDDNDNNHNSCQRTVETNKNVKLQQMDKRNQSISGIRSIQSYYFGSRTVTSNPQLYLQYLEDLIEVYYEKYVKNNRNDNSTASINNNQQNNCIRRPPPPPLIIHLGNWSSKGFGCEIVSTILSRIIQPNHIMLVAADCNNNRNNEFYNSILSSINTNDNPVTKVHRCNAFYAVKRIDCSTNKNYTIGNNNTGYINDNHHQGIDNDNDYFDYDVGTDIYHISNDRTMEQDDHKMTCEQRQSNDNSIITIDDTNIASCQETDTACYSTTPTYNKSNDNNNYYNSLYCTKHSNELIWYVPAPIAPISASVHCTIPIEAYFSLIVDVDNTDNNNNNNCTLPLVHELDILDDNYNNSKKSIADKLSSAMPFVVPYDLINIQFTSPDTRQLDIVNDTTIFAALNGSIVALCISTGKNENSLLNSNNDNNNTLIPCIGMGLVRSVDVKRRLLYILTPLSLQQLQTVDVLMVSSTGDIVFPMNELMFQGPYASSFPYQMFTSSMTTTTTTTINNDNKNSVNGHDTTFASSAGTNNNTNGQMLFEILGTEPMKSRNSIGRRSLMHNN